MKEDIKELKKYLDKKFGDVATKVDVDRRFDGIDQRFEKIDRRFGDVDRRFDVVDKKFGEMATRAEMKEGFVDVDRRFDIVVAEVVSLRTETEHGFTDLKKDFRELQSAVGTYTTRADTYFQEMVMLTQKVQRLERWIEELAAKVGMKLKS